jgi:hypothetical protein
VNFNEVLNIVSEIDEERWKTLESLKQRDFKSKSEKKKKVFH